MSYRPQNKLVTLGDILDGIIELEKEKIEKERIEQVKKLTAITVISGGIKHQAFLSLDYRTQPRVTWEQLKAIFPGIYLEKGASITIG